MVLKAWGFRNPTQRNDIKNFLFNIVLNSPKSLTQFIMNKAIKVLVDIAKQEWPTEFQNLLPTIQQLCQSSTHTVIGLIFLKTVCEEFTSTQNDVTASRKEFLKKVTKRLYFYNLFFLFCFLKIYNIFIIEFVYLIIIKIDS
jgi:hypothetical protein